MPTKTKKTVAKKAAPKKPVAKKVIKKAPIAAKPAVKAVKPATKPVAKKPCSFARKIKWISAIIALLIIGFACVSIFCCKGDRIIEEKNPAVAVEKANKIIEKAMPDYTIYTMFVPTVLTDNAREIQEGLIATRPAQSGFFSAEKLSEKMNAERTTEENREAFLKHLDKIKNSVVSNSNGELGEEADMFVITCATEEFDFCKEAVKTLDKEEIILIRAY